MDYYHLLEGLNCLIKPENYVEIGVRYGDSIILPPPECTCIGIDPEPDIQKPLGENIQIFSQTSDDFFASGELKKILGERKLRLAFIDGMHRFEFALRDFINLEKFADKRSMVLVHDTIPVDEATSAREQQTYHIWTGDVFKLILCLKKYRPDLTINNFDASPSGLALITGLDSTSKVLSERYDEIVEEFIPMSYRDVAEKKAEKLNIVPGDVAGVAKVLHECEGVPVDRTRIFFLERENEKLRKLVHGAADTSPVPVRVYLAKPESPDNPFAAFGVTPVFQKETIQLTFPAAQSKSDRVMITISPGESPWAFILRGIELEDAAGEILWRFDGETVGGRDLVLFPAEQAICGLVTGQRPEFQLPVFSPEITKRMARLNILMLRADIPFLTRQLLRSFDKPEAGSK